MNARYLDLKCTSYKIVSFNWSSSHLDWRIECNIFFFSCWHLKQFWCLLIRNLRLLNSLEVFHAQKCIPHNQKILLHGVFKITELHDPCLFPCLKWKKGYEHSVFYQVGGLCFIILRYWIYYIHKLALLWKNYTFKKIFVNLTKYSVMESVYIYAIYIYYTWNIVFRFIHSLIEQENQRLMLSFQLITLWLFHIEEVKSLTLFCL